MKQNTYTVRIFLMVSLLFFLFPAISAQITIFATDHTVEPDEEFIVDIRANGFEGVVGCQFSLSWDTTLFRIQDADNLQEAGNLNEALESSFENFNVSKADSGFVGFLWFDPSLEPLTLPDNTTLFSLTFKVVEEESTVDSVRFGTFPISVEFADANETILPVDFMPGTITIDGISDIMEPSAKEYLSMQCAPNPFRQQTQLSLDFHKPARATLSIYDASGRLVHQRDRDFATGQHEIELSRSLFGQAGTYLLKVHAADFLITQKIIVL